MISRAVEIAVIAQRQGRLRIRPVGAVEGNQRGQRAIGRHFEHRPMNQLLPPPCSRAVEIAVIAQRQRGIRIRPIGRS